MQWTAVALAFAGVMRLTLAYGGIPWIALALAASFGGYGLVKKKAPSQSSGFVLVWLGLLVFGLDGVRAHRTSSIALLDEGAA